MLFLMVLLTLIETSCVFSNSAGSVIFYNRHCRECWTEDDVAKLRARKVFESIALPQITPDKVSTKYIKQSLRYFRRALHSVEKDVRVDRHSATILKEALADAIGAHLRAEMLPTIRFAYYAGYIPHRSARQIHNFLDEIKKLLNTQGLGWKRPARVPQWSNLTVGKILVGNGKLFNPCAYLVTKRDSNSCIHLPSPKLDDQIEPSAIALPFKIGGLVSLTSPNSENILLKYYTTASRCILGRSPQNCRHTDFVNFNNKLWHWMKRDVAPHLMDEKLYAAYGGVLRIAAAVQNYGKGLSRRNLYDYDDIDDKWSPWRAFKQPSVYINTEWTPQLYIGFLILTGLIVCFVQICYSYTFAGSACQCRGKDDNLSSKDVAYAAVDSNFPAMLPNHDGNSKKDKHLLTKCKSACVGTVKTERVYDLNENTEKFMPVIMSDCEGSEIESTSSSKEGSEEECFDDTVIDVAQTNRARSPPKIDAAVAQLKIEKSPTEHSRKPKYSTSTITNSELTYCREGRTDTAWTATGSTSSDRSTSSVSDTQSRRSRRSRDLAWARKVISKQSIRDHTPKSTESRNADTTTTPRSPSRR